MEELKLISDVYKALRRLDILCQEDEALELIEEELEKIEAFYLKHNLKPMEEEA